MLSLRWQTTRQVRVAFLELQFSSRPSRVKKPLSMHAVMHTSVNGLYTGFMFGDDWASYFRRDMENTTPE